MKKFYSVNGLFLMILIFISLQIYAEYNDFAFSFFSGRQPSARAEAMGRGYVAIGGDIYSTFYNPAGISSIDGFMFNASYVTPYYLLKDATYSFLGIAYKFNRYLIVSVDRYNFNYGEEIEEIGIDGPTGRILKPYDSNYKLSIGSMPLKDFHVGLSANSISLWFWDETYEGLYFDFGVIKSFSFTKYGISEHRINLAGSIFNFSYSKLSEELESYIDGREIIIYEEDLPVIARIGGSYEFLLGENSSFGKSKFFGFLLHTEYQNMLNYEYRTALRFGMELSFWEILFLRAGYYNESVAGVYKNRLSDFTYGFGIQFPSRKVSDKYRRFNVRFDFALMPQVSYVRYGKWDNFLNINLLMNYIF